jgi:hypothetical protein
MENLAHQLNNAKNKEIKQNNNNPRPGGNNPQQNHPTGGNQNQGNQNPQRGNNNKRQGRNKNKNLQMNFTSSLFDEHGHYTHHFPHFRLQTDEIFHECTTSSSTTYPLAGPTIVFATKNPVCIEKPYSTPTYDEYQ